MNNRVYDYLDSLGLKDKIIELSDSTETVEIASKNLNCNKSEVAKTLSFYIPNPILIVTSGDMKISNDKYRLVFGCKPKMIPTNEIEEVIGHHVGGVCPFNPKDDVEVYLDISLLKNKYLYPACGISGTAIKVTIEELMKYTNFIKWIDVCEYEN